MCHDGIGDLAIKQRLDLCPNVVRVNMNAYDETDLEKQYPHISFRGCTARDLFVPDGGYAMRGYLIPGYSRRISIFRDVSWCSLSLADLKRPEEVRALCVSGRAQAAPRHARVCIPPLPNLASLRVHVNSWPFAVRRFVRKLFCVVPYQMLEKLLIVELHPTTMRALTATLPSLPALRHFRLQEASQAMRKRLIRWLASAAPSLTYLELPFDHLDSEDVTRIASLRYLEYLEVPAVFNDANASALRTLFTSCPLCVLKCWAIVDSAIDSVRASRHLERLEVAHSAPLHPPFSKPGWGGAPGGGATRPPPPP